MSLLLLLGLFQATGASGPESDLEWSARFWSETSVEARDAVAQMWLDTEPEFNSVYDALRTGRVYSKEVPTGYILRQRTAEDGVLHPYLVLVPEDYTPEKRWPVRFQLHGGMGAPRWDPELAEWAGGWTRTQGALMVHPAGWVDSMWWHRSQVENFEAILRSLRAEWNIDENRVVAVGNSDGGAALFFLAMRTPDRFASYAGHVAPPDRLVRAAFGPDGQMHVENLSGQAFHLGYGGKDPLVPIKHLRRYMELFESVGARLDWYVLEDRGHQLHLPKERESQFMNFIGRARRDALPDELSWSTESTERYARRSWIRIDELDPNLKVEDIDASRLLPRWGTPIQLRGKTVPRVPFGTVKVARENNEVRVTSMGVEAFTLLLSPAQFDLNLPVRVLVNDVVVREELVKPSVPTLLHWAARDDDRCRLFAAEWQIR